MTDAQATEDFFAAQAMLWLALGLWLMLSGTGCKLVQGVAKAPVQAVRTISPGKEDNAVDPVEVQQRLLRVADQFLTRMVLDTDRLQGGTNAMSMAERLQWKISFVTETCSIVSGANEIANLLDMTVLITMARAAVEDYWQPEVFGESAQSMLEGCREAESNVWSITDIVLTPEHQGELRQAIETWRQLNPLPKNALAARAVGFSAKVAGKSQAGPTKSNSVFDLLMIDPLSGLDPATRELAQTRLFAQRALFVGQNMPALLRWHAELLSLNAVAMPEVHQIITNSTRLSASVEQFARVAEQLPQQVAAEREEIFNALEAQKTTLLPLINEVRQTLAAGSQMSTSLNTTLTTFTALMQRFGVGETNITAAADTNTEPFRIQDYGQTATQLEGAARQLTELLHTLDQTLASTNLAQLSAQMGPVVQQAQTGGKEIVDYAFWRILLLVIVVLLCALAYRFFGARLARPSHPS